MEKLAPARLPAVDLLAAERRNTNSQGRRFVWDYGDTALAASFGVPVVLNMRREGQLAMAASKAGMTSFFVEPGGGPGGPADIEAAFGRYLNTLRYRGHFDDPMTGPKTVPSIPDVSIFMSKMHGNFYGRYPTEHVGSMLEPGEIGAMINVMTGEPMETFVLKKPGELLLANVSPYIMTPCFCAYVVGHAGHEDVISSRRWSASSCPRGELWPGDGCVAWRR